MMSGISAKRQREDDFEKAELDWERGRKKPRPLPFRTSLTSKHTTLFSQTHHFFPSADISPPTITPVESSDDDDNGTASYMVMPPQGQMAKKDDIPFLTIRVHPCHDADSDLEMTDPPRTSSNPITPYSAILSPIPQSLIVQSLNISGGRTATPIYGHFTANMSLNTMREDSNIANDTSAFIPCPATVSARADVVIPISSSSASSLPALTDGEDWWRRRRLPSPISEDEVSPTTTFPPINRDLKSNISTTTDDTSTSSFLTLPWERKPSATAELEQQTWAQHDPLNHIAAHAAAAAGNSKFPERNHQPMIAQDNSWQIASNPAIRTWTPQQSTTTTTTFPQCNGIFPFSNNDIFPLQRDKASRPPKVSIAMGYRADCDKCQRRVPGHYSHIIRG
ncbi:hypothetical protein BDBG_07045 [Blastomyces gilchristii SLH14081]|uniref:Uncharacterized protein n=2 Tax=Blastomyces TaxID=229219 RepID=A0A179UU07_BLAGS|nr:uncharacterized protein BDBG_07045 [Blastomyces gilchristii SLH14081]EGE78612.2 hypothetical protein BDDG_01549 [Blastomyces dermatitidis ATCC 18188]OAT11596.1 hypothetical protein BDBG_07045 [Blastomyces gilchristii SLH14081]